jgi:anti-repressor protein
VNAVAVRQETTVHAFPVTGQTVRTTQKDGEPWFVVADSCSVLAIRNSRDAIATLDHDERGVATIDTPGGPQGMAIVSESGLYSLIMRSRKAEAKAFRRWVTHDVIPAIRRTGSYGAPAVPSLDTPAGVLQLAEVFHETAKRLVTAETRVAELAPAAEAWEVLAEATGDYSLRDAAHILNRDPAIDTGQNRLMRFLRDEGMVDRKSVPYVQYGRYLVERPITYQHPGTGEPKLSSQIRITVDGLEFLRRRLGGLREVAA